MQASTALWPGTDVRIEINGENGTAIMSGERMETWKFRDERPEDAGIRQYGSGAAATGATGAADLGFADHQVVIEDLARAVLSGGEPMITLETRAAHARMEPGHVPFRQARPAGDAAHSGRRSGLVARRGLPGGRADDGGELH